MKKEQEKQIIRQYLNSTYSSQEVKKITESLHRADEQGILEELAAEVWEEAGGYSSTSDPNKEQYSKAEALLKKVQPRNYSLAKRLFYTATGIAASILLIMGGISLKQYWEIRHIVMTQIETSFGEKKELTLPDGSQIVLNACSQLQYPTEFAGNTREVHLNGEAYFKIKPNPQKPFQVQTDDFQVEVLGTEFNVKSYSHDQIQSVEVESGKVQVKLPEDHIRLKKQEQIYLNRQSGEYSKLKRCGNKIAVWRKGALYFHQTPLVDVARELERRYHCRISFREGQPFDNLISGEHDNQNLESILESLHYICGIKYEKEGENIVLYK